MAETKNFPFLLDLWLRTCGLPSPKDRPVPQLPSVKKIRERNDRLGSHFRHLQRNRLVVGAFRYGMTLAPGKPQYDRLEMIRKKLDIYKETGNLEMLVDIANLAEMEFLEGVHPKKHFRALDR